MKHELRARGTSVMLEHGGLPEVLNPYLIDLINQTGGPEGPIGLQFIAQPELENETFDPKEADPLVEDEHEVTPGLVYKYQSGEDEYGPYPGRALFTITRNCAAYCRYCTRGREVGIPANLDGPFHGALSHTPHLSKEQIDTSLEYIRTNPGIREVILSGGDPMTVKPEVLKYVCYQLGQMQNAGELDIVRIGTRFLIQNPLMLKNEHLEAVSFLRHPRLMMHINHEWELTEKSLEAIHRFQDACKGTVMSQSVLLKGVNDHPQTLRNLFNKIAIEGWVPYYLFNCDLLPWANRFRKDFFEVVDIWGHVRPVLSGVAATARLVIDTPFGSGKIPLPEGNAWMIDYGQGYRDFKGFLHDVYGLNPKLP